MIATISMAEDNLSETISTCRFSQRVASILNAAKKNEEIDDKSMIKRLRKRVAELEAENSVLKYGSIGAVPEDCEGLTDEEKTACAQIVQNFLQGQILDPVTAGITDPNKFRECMKVFKSLLMDTVQSGTVRPEATTQRKLRAGYHQDAPTLSTTARMSAGPMAFRDDTHTLLRNYTYLRADHDRAAPKPAAASDTSRSYLSGSSPIGRFMMRQSAVAWASPQQKSTAAGVVGKAGDVGGQGSGGSGGPPLPSSPYEAKQVKEAMKLNKKVSESLVQQTKEQEHLKAFHSSVLEQELELAEQDLARRTQAGTEQIARQRAYMLKLRQDGASAELIEQELLVERHLANRQAKMEAQLSAASERLHALRSMGVGGGDASAGSPASPSSADAAAIAMMARAATTTTSSSSFAGGSGDAPATGSMEDKLRLYVKNNGKLNAKAVLDAMQQQDRLQKQIQEKIDRQRVLVLSRQLEVKESATRQKLLELKARLSQQAAASASAPLTEHQEAFSDDGAEAVMSSPSSLSTHRTSASEAAQTLRVPPRTPPPTTDPSAVQTAEAHRGAHVGQAEATGSGHAAHRPTAAAAAAVGDTRRSAFVPVQHQQQQQQQQSGSGYAAYGRAPAAASSAGESTPAANGRGGPQRGSGSEHEPVRTAADTTSAEDLSRRPAGQSGGSAGRYYAVRDSRIQQLGRPAMAAASASALGPPSAAAAAAEGRRQLQQADGDTIWSAAAAVAGSGGREGVADSKRRQIDEVVEKYRALRLALKQKKEEVLARAGERWSVVAAAAAASAAHGQPAARHSDNGSAVEAPAAAAAAGRVGSTAAERPLGRSGGGRLDSPSAASRSTAERSSSSQAARVTKGAGSGGGGRRSGEPKERVGAGGGEAVSRRRLAVTMSRYKKDGLASAARYSRSSHGNGGGSSSSSTSAGVGSAPGGGSGRGTGRAYFMQQMMAAAALDATAAAAAAGGGAAAAQQQPGYRARDEAPLNARLRLILTKEVMRRLVVQ